MLLASVASAADSTKLPLEQWLSPAGSQVFLAGLRPKGVCISPDGAWLVTAGARNQLLVLDPVGGALRQSLSFAGPGTQPPSGGPGVPPSGPDKQLSFTGLAFSPDGHRLFASDFSGAIRLFSAGPGGLSFLRSFNLPPPREVSRAWEIPAGLAVSPDGGRLYVAANLSNELLELDAATGAVLRRFEVGVAPYDVVLARGKAYVSNWGGRRPDGAEATGPAGSGTTVRVDPVTGAASEGSVSVSDLARGRVSAELTTGRHASGLARAPGGDYVVVANANEDTLSVVGTAADRVVETFSLRWQAGDLFGASPNALAFDPTGSLLFACAGTQNAVAVIRFKPGACRLLGLIPVGWFPGAIAFDGLRGTLCVANLKGDGRQESKPGNPGAFHTYGMPGSLSLVHLPTPEHLREMTRTVLADYRRSVIDAAMLPARPSAPRRPVPERAGEPSVFRHVIYVIKENRTYDQILGDVTPGNGDPGLCVYGGRITPNLHKLAREFALLDNAFCAGILSVDGHQWVTAGVADDYVEKSFSSFPRSYPYGGTVKTVLGREVSGLDALAYSPTGFIWDNAIAHGVSVRNYGEFMLTRVRWADGRAGRPGYGEIRRAYAGRTRDIVIGCEPGVAALAPVSKLDTAGWNLDVSDQFRVDRFLEEFHQFEHAGNLPGLVILYLPQDHTCGTKPGLPTPRACQADNDLAVGRVAEALSHSRYWRDTCLFAMEDDPQDGWDHVSGYRTTAYVVSAYTRRRAVVSARYTQPGLLRTIELILGLPPMNQLDAAGLPWKECFQDRPDLSGFDAVPNAIPLDQLNPPPVAVVDPALRRDELVSARLPFDQPDQCPEDVLNGILWRAQRGSRAPYPAWAVLGHPDGDTDD